MSPVARPPTENEHEPGKNDRDREIPVVNVIRELVREGRSWDLSRDPIGNGRETQPKREGGYARDGNEPPRGPIGREPY